VEDGRAQRVRSTDITDDTEVLAAKADEGFINETVDLAKKSAAQISENRTAGGAQRGRLRNRGKPDSW